MLTADENELLTRTGPETAAGALLRRYWQPVALSEELLAGNPLNVRVLGEDLVLFRDEAGRVGLLGLHCSHRGADLSYGRIENGGLRCPYHGWLYDVGGRCLDQPGEYSEHKFHQRVRHPSYPCRELGDVIFAYMGAGEPPLLPAYDALLAPPEYRFVTKYFTECNYLQANEGTMDPVHLSFLHRRLDKGLRERTSESFRLSALDFTPRVEVEERDFGLRIYSARKIGEDSIYLRTNNYDNYVYPNITVIGGETEKHGYTIHWHVPITDECNWRYHIVYSNSKPLDKAAIRKSTASKTDGKYRLLRNPGNRYLQDRGDVKDRSFLGMGEITQVEDAYAVQSQGAIQNRTREHLGNSDIGDATARQLLLKAIRTLQEGGDPPHVIREPGANYFPGLFVVSEVFPADKDLKEHVRQIEVNRRTSLTQERER
jgi:phenylpropionate dioxygenase-like ring-hydroxylating dioxygenase large terminal subunit